MARLVKFTPTLDWTPIVEDLREGAVVAFPTDTVYGIGADLFREDALERIYRIKGREFCKPLPVLVASIEDVARVARDLPPAFFTLAGRYWPGALTLVVPAAPGLPNRLTAGGSSVGVRMPAHPAALALLRACGGALATTSANRSGEAEARRAEEVLATLGGQLDWVIDGGPCEAQTPSTVLDLTNDPPRVLRQGPVEIGNCKLEIEV